MKSLLRLALVASLLAVATVASAGYEPGYCTINCSNGTGHIPFLTDSATCCEQFYLMCGGYGEAYLDETGPYPDRIYCPSYPE